MLYGATTVLAAENSEVLPVGPVAVAVTVRPKPTFWVREKVKLTLPEASVVTDFCPMKVLPSSVPEVLEKKRTTKVFAEALFSVPRTVVEVAEVRSEQRRLLSLLLAVVVLAQMP